MSPHAAGLVLVVEDEAGFRQPLEYLLRARSYDVITADRADTALRLLEQATPDAAIIDLELAAGSGRDVIRQMPEGSPVIIFSGMEGGGDAASGRRHTTFVEKPASLTWLLDTLDGMLRTARGAPPHEAAAG